MGILDDRRPWTQEEFEQLQTRTDSTTQTVEQTDLAQQYLDDLLYDPFCRGGACGR